MGNKTMAYNETLAGRIRIKLSDQEDVAEKTTFGSLCFMLNGKMLLCVQTDGLLCRVGNEQMEAALARPGTHPMVHGGRTMKGYVHVEEIQVKDDADLGRWLNLCLAYNAVLTA